MPKYKKGVTMNINEKQICAESGSCKSMEMDRKTVEEIVHQLRRAYCDEWLAFIQYWTAAQVVKGFTRTSTACELLENANEELEHARMLADRIQELCGEIPVSPQEIIENCNCAFVAPTDPCAYRIMCQSIASERCAIAVYNRMLKMIGDRDPVTSHLVLEILEDEVEHEFEFRQIKEDIDASREALGLGKEPAK